MTIRPLERWLTAPNLVVAGTLVVGLLLWGADAFTMFGDDSRYTVWGELAVLLVAVAVQSSAQVRPTAAAVAMLVLVIGDLWGGPSLPLWIAATDVVYLVVLGGSPRVRRIVIGVAVVATATAVAVGAWFGGARLGVFGGLIAAAFLLSPIGYAHAVIATRRAGEVQRAAAASEAQAARAAALADERRRVSRELHDTVAGHVSAIAILSEAARDADDPGPVVESIRGNSLAALAELRSMIDLLASDDDEAVTVRWNSLQPLVAAADVIGSTVTVSGDVTGLPVRTEASLTRIVGEALANATKHAPGNPIAVDVRRADDLVLVRVENALDGAPVPAGAARGRGLANMALRAESAGGRVDARPRDGMWVVDVAVPVIGGSEDTR